MKLEYYDEYNNHKEFYTENFSSFCPHCNHDVEYKLHYGKLTKNAYNFFVECPRCHEFSVVRRDLCSNNYMNLINSKAKIKLPDLLKELSPKFCEIYQQAHLAYQYDLKHLVGIGLGKALEQLVYDYLVTVQGDEPTYKFAKNIKMLKDFDDAITQLTLSRFVRNDETHPIKESEFNIDDLIESVEHLIRLFEAKYSTFKLNKKLINKE